MMPTSSRSGRRSVKIAASGKDAGSTGRQRRDPRQDTLTQMDFVKLLARNSPEQEIEYEDSRLDTTSGYEEIEAQRPRKRRKRADRATHSPEPTQDRTAVCDLVPTRSYSSPGPVTGGAVSYLHEDSNCSAVSAQTALEVGLAGQQPADDRALMPPPKMPKTPARLGRRYVPSSQSPETTPLSAVKGPTEAQELQGSPLKEKSANPRSVLRRSQNGTKPANPFRRFRVADTFSSGHGEEDGFVAEAQNEVPKKKAISALHLSGPLTPKTKLPQQKTHLKKRLEESPDIAGDARIGKKPPLQKKRPDQKRSPGSQRARATKHFPEVVYVASSSQLDQSPDAQPRALAAPKSFSQATTQDPTQANFNRNKDPPLPVIDDATIISDSQCQRSLPEGPSTSRIPSSQMTTQLPTQFNLESIDAIEVGGEKEFDHAPTVAKIGRIASSQATTVIPSSDPMSEHTPEPKQRSTAASKSKKSSTQKKASEAQAAARPFQMPTSSQALGGWEWDGKDWTESQLLPETLMNFALPKDLVPASQESLASLCEEAPVDVASARHMPFVSQKQPVATIDSVELTRSPQTAVKVKEEPITQKALSPPSGTSKRKKTYSRAQRGPRKRVKEEVHV